MSTDKTVGITIGEVKGLYADLNEKLASENCQEWYEALKLFLKKQNPWEAVRAAANTVAEKVSKIFRITVNHHLPLKEMIKAGKYDWVNDDITEKRFPVPAGDMIELDTELFHLDCTISSENVLIEMDKKDYRPATIHELLAFGVSYPDVQREFPIVALGSVAEVDGDRYVACLDRDDSVRDLGLDWFDDGWPRRYRFLAVRYSFCFSRNIVPGVLFTICRRQPPCIFPISSKCSPKCMYFPVSIIFISHAN